MTLPRRPDERAASIDELMAGLPPTLRALAERGVVKRASRRNTVLIEQGDAGNTLLIILAGSLRAYASDLDGRELTYGIYGPGHYVGEMSLDGGPRSASIATLEPTTYVVVTRETLLRHLREQPEFALELLAKVIRVARTASEMARQMALLDVSERVLGTLERLAQLQADGSLLVTERLTHLDLAQRVGCSREMVTRVLKDLSRTGQIEPLEHGCRIPAAGAARRPTGEGQRR